jgi:hypothetical protein
MNENGSWGTLFKQIAYLLGEAVRSGDNERFLEIYDNVLPKNIPVNLIEQIKEEARNYADLPNDQFLILARNLAVARTGSRKNGERICNGDSAAYLSIIADEVMDACIQNRLNSDFLNNNVSDVINTQLANSNTTPRCDRIDSQSSSVYASCDESTDLPVKSSQCKNISSNSKKKKSQKKGKKPTDTPSSVISEPDHNQISGADISPSSNDLWSSLLLEQESHYSTLHEFANGDSYSEIAFDDFTTVKSRKKKPIQPNGIHNQRSHPSQSSRNQCRHISPTFTDETSSLTDCTIVFSDSGSVNSEIANNGIVINKKNPNTYASRLKKSLSPSDLPQAEQIPPHAEPNSTSPLSFCGTPQSFTDQLDDLGCSHSTDRLSVDEPSEIIVSLPTGEPVPATVNSQSQLSFQFEGSISPPSCNPNQSQDKTISNVEASSRISDLVVPAITQELDLLLPNPGRVGLGMLQFGDINMTELDKSTGDFNLFEATSFLAEGWEAFVGGNRITTDSVPVFGAANVPSSGTIVFYRDDVTISANMSSS